MKKNVLIPMHQGKEVGKMNGLFVVVLGLFVGFAFLAPAAFSQETPVGYDFLGQPTGSGSQNSPLSYSATGDQKSGFPAGQYDTLHGNPSDLSTSPSGKAAARPSGGSSPFGKAPQCPGVAGGVTPC